MYKVIISPYYKTNTGKTVYDHISNKERIVPNSGQLLGYIVQLVERVGPIYNIEPIPQPEYLAQEKANRITQLLLDMPESIKNTSSLQAKVKWINDQLFEQSKVVV